MCEALVLRDLDRFLMDIDAMLNQNAMQIGHLTISTYVCLLTQDNSESSGLSPALSSNVLASSVLASDVSSNQVMNQVVNQVMNQATNHSSNDFRQIHDIAQSLLQRNHSTRQLVTSMRRLVQHSMAQNSQNAASVHFQRGEQYR